MSLSQNGNSGLLDDDIIHTTDEEGVGHRFQLIDTIEIGGQRYGLLLYLGEDTDETEEEGEGYEDEEVVVMRIITEDGESIFEAIDDEEEFERVVAYVEQMEEEAADEEDPASN